MRYSPLYLSLGILTLILLGVLVILNHDRFSSSLACSNLEWFKKSEIRSGFARKYIDEKNHNAPTVIFNHHEKFVLPFDPDPFYNFIQAGDSIVKDKESDTMKVYRDGQVYSFRIDFDCSY